MYMVHTCIRVALMTPVREEHETFTTTYSKGVLRPRPRPRARRRAVASVLCNTAVHLRLSDVFLLATHKQYAPLAQTLGDACIIQTQNEARNKT